MVAAIFANPAFWQAAASIGGSLLGGMSGNNAAKTQERMAKDAMRIQGTAYSPINVFSPGGMGVTFGAGAGTSGTPGVASVVGGAGGAAAQYAGKLFGGNVQGKNGQIKDLGNGFREVGRYGLQSNIGNVNLNYGDLTDPRLQLGALAGELSQGAGLQGLSPLQLLGLGLAGQGAQSFGADTGMYDSLMGLMGSNVGGAQNVLQGAYANPFQASLQAALFGGAGQQFADAAQGFGDYRNQTLDLLRQQAKPFEDRAFANLNQNLFSTGRMGTTGGALQTEAFARGLGQADLQRQLQAADEARAAQTQSLNVGTGLAGQGNALQEMQNQILSGATSRFGALAELANQLSTARQSQGLAAAQGGAGLFGLGQQALTSPYDVQSAALRNLAGVLEGTSQIQNQGTALAELANLFMTQQANTRTGQASLASNLGNQMSAGDQYKASLFGSLGSALSGGKSPLETIIGAFGGGQSKVQEFSNPVSYMRMPSRFSNIG